MPANIVTLGARLTLAAAGLSLATAAITQASAQKASAHAAKPAPAPAPAPAANSVKGPSVPVPKPSPVADASAIKEKGRELFATWGCASCHSLADADASGHVGPAFDNNPNITPAFVVNRVTNGQGAMPAFGGQMTDEEIQAVSVYISAVAQK